MIGILIDTSVIIDFLRQPKREDTLQIDLEKSGIPLFISIVTHTECYSGKSVWEKEKAKVALKVLLDGIKILPLEEKLSHKAGKIKAYYNTDTIDAIIAATAISHKLTLATLNTKHFEKIKGLKLFKQ